ncbi:MAG: hypothetical protein K1W33_05015 [Clostridia bacterium]|nr:hypothetical protein [Clostridia bacterium]
MDNLTRVSLLGLAFGMLGTTIGGIIGSIVKINSPKFLGFILEFAGRTYDCYNLF